MKREDGKFNFYLHNFDNGCINRMAFIADCEIHFDVVVQNLTVQYIFFILTSVYLF